jgi:hypothetical protein
LTNDSADGLAHPPARDRVPAGTVLQAAGPRLIGTPRAFSTSRASRRDAYEDDPRSWGAEPHRVEIDEEDPLPVSLLAEAVHDGKPLWVMCACSRRGSSKSSASNGPWRRQAEVAPQHHGQRRIPSTGYPGAT